MPCVSTLGSALPLRKERIVRTVPERSRRQPRGYNRRILQQNRHKADTPTCLRFVRFEGKADIGQRLLPLATSSEQILELRPVDRFCGLDGLKADPDRGLGARGSHVAWTVNRNASKVSLNAMARLSCIFRQPVRLGTRIRPWRSEGPRSVPSRSTERPMSTT